MPLLIPIEIRGLGTPDIESLPSYIHRLAWIHSVTVATLLKHVNYWYQSRYPRNNICITNPRSAGDLSVYSRPNGGTENLITILTEAVNNKNLKGTTFLSLYKAIVRTSKIFSKKMRWCPICMHESEINQDEGYFKLIWSAESIEHCPTHNSKLVDKCPACGKTQGGYGYKIEPVKCQSCHAYLSQTNLDDIDFTPSWNAQGSDMYDLVKFISKHPQTTFPEGGVKNVLSSEYDKAWNSNTEQDLWKIIPNNDCIGIVEGCIPITLKRARVIAYRFGVDLTDLLLGDISKSPAMLNSQWSAELPLDIKPHVKKKNRDHDKILQDVHKLMKTCKHKPKPLQFYADSVGVSTGYLHYNHPVLSQRILDGYRAWKKQEKERKQRAAYNNALKLIINYKGNPAGFSKKGALREIRSKTSLPKEVVRKAINNVHRIVMEGII